MEEDISLIKKLDPGKDHRCENISIKMIKICSDSLTAPLRIIFEQSLKKDNYPEIWKKANVVPVHKKDDKDLSKSYNF